MHDSDGSGNSSGSGSDMNAHQYFSSVNQVQVIEVSGAVNGVSVAVIGAAEALFRLCTYHINAQKR